MMLDKEPEDGEHLDDANLLELWPLPVKERYTDFNISKNLTYQQRQDIKELFQVYGDIFTESAELTQLEQLRIEMITKHPMKVKSYPLCHVGNQSSREK